MSKVTIKDVAAEANVAKSTVSHALNRTAPVREETRKRIERAVKKLGYRPSSIGRGLAHQRTNSIGLVITKPGRGLLGSPVLDWINAIHEATSSTGYNILLSIDSERSQYLELVETRAIDGLLLTCPLLNDDKYLELIRKEFPFVLIGKSNLPIKMNSVDIDNFVAILKATEYLLDLGHRKIGFAGPVGPQFQYAAARLDGFKYATSKVGCYREDLVVFGDLTVDGGALVTEQLLSVEPEMSAILVGDDMMLPGVYGRLSQKGLRVPQDLSIVGFGDLEYSRTVLPAATSVCVPYYKMGYEAVRLLIDSIDSRQQGRNVDTVVKSIVVDTNLVVRDSTRPL